jgi:hypothetical protein
MTLPLIALRRMRSDSGSVILPGNPVPGSDAWSDSVRAKRIKQGFCAEAPKPKAKRKKASGKAAANKD